MFLLLHNKSLLQCVYTSVFVFVCFALILCFSFFSMTNQVKPTSLSWLNEESLSHLKILEAHLHPTWQHIPFFGNDFEMIEENCCHQNPLPAPPWHSPVWWHVRPKYENILAKEMRLAHQSIVEPLMKKKHFGAMIWKVFLEDASILPNIPNIHQSREDFWMKSDLVRPSHSPRSHLYLFLKVVIHKDADPQAFPWRPRYLEPVFKFCR